MLRQWSLWRVLPVFRKAETFWFPAFQPQWWLSTVTACAKSQLQTISGFPAFIDAIIAAIFHIVKLFSQRSSVKRRDFDFKFRSHISLALWAYFLAGSPSFKSFTAPAWTVWRNNRPEGIKTNENYENIFTTKQHVNISVTENITHNHLVIQPNICSQPQSQPTELDHWIIFIKDITVARVPLHNWNAPPLLSMLPYNQIGCQN